MKERVITDKVIERFRKHLLTEEKSANTVEKYLRDVRAFAGYAGGAIGKETVIAYKRHLTDTGYAVRSINSMLASI